MVYNPNVMENHNPNPDTSNFVPAVCKHHRAMATCRYTEALEWARIARDSAPCDSEAAHWSNIVRGLEAKTRTGLDAILHTLGFRSKKAGSK